jgi:hypothetical protein
LKKRLPAGGSKKTSANRGPWQAHANARRSKSFLLLFLKKEALPFLLSGF